MKKIQFITIFLSAILWHSVSYGQEIDATPEILLRSTSTYEIIGTVQDVTMVLLKDNDRYKVKAFDETMNRKWERDLRFERKNARVVGVVTYKNYFSVFYKYKYRNHLHLRMRKYNNDLKIVDSTTVKWYPRRAYSPNPEMYISQDKNKIFFLSNSSETLLDIIVFDNKKEKTTLDINISPPDFSYRRDFLDALVDNKGGVHLLMEYGNKKSKKEENRLEFISILESDNSFKNYSIDFQSNLWYDLETSYDNLNERIIVSGLYSDRTTVEAHGIFYMNVNPLDSQNPTVKFTPFDNDYLTLVLGKKIDRNVGFSDVNVQKIIPRSDGGILMIAERNKKYIRNTGIYNNSYYGRNHNMAQTDYYFNEILLYSFNPTGEVHWKEILHKKQYSQDDNGEFSSFFLFLNRSNLRLIYNDAIKSTGTVYEYVVSGTGDSDRASLFNTKPYKFMLKMTAATQVSANTLIVPSERRSYLRLVKLTF